MIRESIPSIVRAYRMRDIKPDQVHKVKQGKLNIWYCANLFVAELVIGEKSMTGKITTPGAILMTNGYAYRNTSNPQDIAEDIYASNQGDEKVELLNPITAASVLGKLGGSVTSKTSRAKGISSANNGRLGGRPKGSKNKPAA